LKKSTSPSPPVAFHPTAPPAVKVGGRTGAACPHPIVPEA